MGRAVAARRRDEAGRALARWRRHAEVAVEIVDHLEPHSTFRAARLAELAAGAGVPAVLTNAVRYLDPVDSLAAQILDAARRLVPLGSPRLVPHNGRAYLAGPADMAVAAERVAAAMSVPRARSTALGLLRATADLAARCALDPGADLGIGDQHLPGERRAARPNSSRSSAPAARTRSSAAGTGRPATARGEPAAGSPPRRPGNASSTS